MALTDGTSEQFLGSPFGANLPRLMDAYPLSDEEVEPEKTRINYRLTEEQLKDLELMADYWNELDKALGIKRKREWSVQTVLDRFRAIGSDLFWNQVGGRPATQEDREAFIGRAIEHLKKKKVEKKK